MRSLPLRSDSARGVGRFALYASIGIAVGAVVAALEWVSLQQLLVAVIEAPLWVRATAPPAGVVLTAVLLRVGGRTDASTSDLYVKAFHGQMQLRRRELLPKLGGAVATVGAGGTVGLEGPAIHAGATIGGWFGGRTPGLLGHRPQRVLLAAGAAAGVAAVFKAPATGVLFALEAPYRRDVARQALIPSLVAAAAAYVTLVVILGPERLIPVGPVENVSLTQEIIGALIIGVGGGLAARATALTIQRAKLMSKQRWHVRLPLAGLVMIGAGLLGDQLVDEPIMLGPGAEAAVEIVLDNSVSLWVVAALFCLRLVSTSATLAAGGVGGVFIPLVVQGLLLGRIAEVFFDSPPPGLFPVVALAAVLGAGYRTPLAAVVFVAESTGRAEFVIPALLATAISQSLMGDVSVSSGQVGERQGRLEQRLELGSDEVASSLPPLVAPSDPLLEIVDRLEHFEGVPAAPVADGHYIGLLVLSDIAVALMEHGPDALVSQIVRSVPAIPASETALSALATMTEHNSAAVVVVDAHGVPIGMITAASMIEVDEVLRTPEGPKRR